MQSTRMGRLLFWRNGEKGGHLGHEGRPAGEGLCIHVPPGGGAQGGERRGIRLGVEKLDNGLRRLFAPS